MSKRSDGAASAASIEDAIHDNRMFAERAFYCIANGAGELYFLSQSELRLPLLQVVSSNKYFSVGVQSPTEINAPRGRTLSGRQWFCADRNEV